MIGPGVSLSAAARLMARCELLARCTDTPGSITRTFLSPAMREAHGLVASWMEEAGLRVRVDPAGNLRGRRGERGAPVFLVGSHLDTVPDAGRFDGVLGVLAGIEAAELLRGTPLPFALEVVGFSDEEGVRFERPYLGSMALAGGFDPALLERLDASGTSLRQAIRDFGLDPERVGQAALRPEQVAGYAELHLEQGPVLEDLGHPVGVVEAIAGQERLVLEFRGEAGHAGTVPMGRRRDAAVGLARMILAVRDLARVTKGLRATVGSALMEPNVRNVIPGQARFTVDLRHADDKIRHRAVRELLARCEEVAREEALDWALIRHEAEASVPMDPDLVTRMEEAVAACGHPVHRMVSGAGHDAAVLAPRFPSVMLFVRHPGGISHHPDERVEEADVAAALAVLAEFLLSVGKSAR